MPFAISLTFMVAMLVFGACATEAKRPSFWVASLVCLVGNLVATGLAISGLF